MIDIKGLEKGAVLKALFDASKQQGMGLYDRSGAEPIRLEDATEIVQARTRTQRNAQTLSQETTCQFDYLRGRVLKVDIGGDAFDPRLYDRDNGSGAAFRAIDELRHGAGAPTASGKRPTPTYKDSLLAVMTFVHKMSVGHPDPAVREEAKNLEVDFVIATLCSSGNRE